MVIPNLDKSMGMECFNIVHNRNEGQVRNLPVITSCHDIGLITAMVVVDIVDTLFVRLERKVGDRVSKRPDLDGMVQTGGRKCLRVLWVDGESHNVVGVPFKYLP